MAPSTGWCWVASWFCVWLLSFPTSPWLDDEFSAQRRDLVPRRLGGDACNIEESLPPADMPMTEYSVLVGAMRAMAPLSLGGGGHGGLGGCQRDDGNNPSSYTSCTAQGKGGRGTSAAIALLLLLPPFPSPSNAAILKNLPWPHYIMSFPLQPPP